MKRIFKRNIYLLFGLTALCSGIIGCDDRIDDSVSPVSGQELVTVPLSFGFAEESFGELSVSYTHLTLPTILLV